jgi:hypothetical protein
MHRNPTISPSSFSCANKHAIPRTSLSNRQQKNSSGVYSYTTTAAAFARDKHYREKSECMLFFRQAFHRARFGECVADQPVQPPLCFDNNQIIIAEYH